MSIKPKFLSRATIDLWQSNPGGTEIDGDAVFLGAAAENLKLGFAFQPLETRPTGAQYARRRHIDEHHVIQIERVWATDETEGEFLMERNRNYIMQITWTDDEDENITHTRTYYGVTNVSADISSQSINESMQDQVFSAQYFI